MVDSYITQQTGPMMVHVGLFTLRNWCSSLPHHLLEFPLDLVSMYFWHNGLPIANDTTYQKPHIFPAESCLCRIMPWSIKRDIHKNTTTYKVCSTSNHIKTLWDCKHIWNSYLIQDLWTLCDPCAHSTRSPLSTSPKRKRFSQDHSHLSGIWQGKSHHRLNSNINNHIKEQGRHPVLSPWPTALTTNTAPIGDHCTSPLGSDGWNLSHPENGDTTTHVSSHETKCSPGALPTDYAMGSQFPQLQSPRNSTNNHTFSKGLLVDQPDNTNTNPLPPIELEDSTTFLAPEIVKGTGVKGTGVILGEGLWWRVEILGQCSRHLGPLLHQRIPSSSLWSTNF